jgi:hypothetical protein
VAAVVGGGHGRKPRTRGSGQGTVRASTTPSPR